MPMHKQNTHQYSESTQNLILLILQEAKEMMRGMAHELPDLAEAKITALVVDDDYVNQTIHHRLLDRLGIQNEVVCNGKEAVDAHCSGKTYDLILMDMDMPVMNGIQATRKLREMGIGSVIAGVSTRTKEVEKKEFMEAGLDDFQEKPLTISKLLSILHKLNQTTKAHIICI